MSGDIMTSSNSDVEAIFGIRRSDRTTVLIDGMGLHYATKSVPFDLDFARLRDYFKANCNLRRLIYYTVLQIEEDENGQELHNPIKPVIGFLSYNGYVTVVNEKFISSEEMRDSNRRPPAGNMISAMSADIILHAETSDHLVIFSGNNDLANACAAAKSRYNTKITGVSTVKGKNNAIGEDFRMSCDEVVDLNNERLQLAIKKLPPPVSRQAVEPPFRRAVGA